ncbi:response regulator [Streptomyces violascens]|uniref:response regulator n=1 Tax=Streptomyces violascens TaxID=67381 RepID=UPI0037BCCFEE
MVRVLVVDDEELVRVALQRILDAAPGIETLSCDGPKAVELTLSASPDVVLLDVNMPVVDGFSVLRELRTLPEPPAVAMLTLLGADEYLDSALRLGASGYLLKDSEPRLLVDCVLLLARGGVVYAPSGSRSLVDARVRAPLPTPAPPGLRELITNREYEVLALLAAGETNAQLADRLGMGMATVKTHIGSLKKKLNAPSRIALAAIAHREGIVGGPARR